MEEGGEWDSITHFSCLPSILPSRTPITALEFTTTVAGEDLDFVMGFSVTDRKSFIGDVSQTLLRSRSLISIVVVGQENVMGSSKLSRERDELRESYEAFE